MCVCASLIDLFEQCCSTRKVALLGKWLLLSCFCLLCFFVLCSVRFYSCASANCLNRVPFNVPPSMHHFADLARCGAPDALTKLPAISCVIPGVILRPCARDAEAASCVTLATFWHFVQLRLRLFCSPTGFHTPPTPSNTPKVTREPPPASPQAFPLPH